MRERDQDSVWHQQVSLRALGRGVRGGLRRVPALGLLSRRQAAWLVVAFAVLATAVGGVRVGFALGTRYQTVTAASAPVVGGTAPAGIGEGVYKAAAGSVVTITVDGGGLGSGFFYRPNWVATNLHVVATNAAKGAQALAGQPTHVTVLLADKRKVTGTVKLVDPRLDLALVQVPTGLNVPPLQFADLAQAHIGEPVAVIGSPEGLTGSVSTGVLSGMQRNPSFRENAAQTNLLQTDAAINPGNSGGPLLDAAGHVLGIVTLRPDALNGRSAEGLGFAIGADMIRSSINQLEAHGKVDYVWLGITARDAGPDDGTAGAYVATVLPGSPAAKAGISVGDVITGLDGMAVSSFGDLTAALAGHAPGQTIPVVVSRHHKPLTLSLTLVARPGDR